MHLEMTSVLGKQKHEEPRLQGLPREQIACGGSPVKDSTED